MSTSDVSTGSAYTVRDNNQNADDTNESDEDREEADYENQNESGVRGSGGGSVINDGMSRESGHTVNSRHIPDEKRNGGELNSGGEEREGVRGFSRRQSPHSSPLENRSSLRKKIRGKNREKNEIMDTDEDEDSGVEIGGNKNSDEGKKGRKEIGEKEVRREIIRYERRGKR